jgi:hypothetical protein
MPIVDHYFAVVNPSTPIFDQLVITRTITKWFGTTAPKRDVPTWATILVIIALGLQALPSTDSTYLSTIAGEDAVSHCMRNAQGVLPELMMHEDLVGIQVVLALAMLYRNSMDLRPASILTSMAARLVFRLQLHSRHSADFFTADENRQRSNVFWSTYIVDKCVSMKSKEPTFLADAEIDIDLPDGPFIFCQSVALAQLQGKVYSLLLSSRSLTMDVLERQKHVADIQAMLEAWYLAIPQDFQMEAALTRHNLPELTHLYHAYLLTLVCTHGIWSEHATWMQSLNSLSRAAIQDMATILQGAKVVKACTQGQLPPTAHGWEYTVQVARHTLQLFRQSPPTQQLIW